MTTRTRAAASTCSRCNAPLPGRARRCIRCGAQVFVAPEVDPQAEARVKRERLLRKYGLNEIQTAILAAASTGTRSIFVVGSDTVGEGEVKSGDQRFYGNDAVMAIAALAGPGLIAPQGDDCFRLTDAGERLVKALDETSAAEPPAVPGP